jgi:hypothetical protein
MQKTNTILSNSHRKMAEVRVKMKRICKFYSSKLIDLEMRLRLKKIQLCRLKIKSMRGMRHIQQKRKSLLNSLISLGIYRRNLRMLIKRLRTRTYKFMSLSRLGLKIRFR